MDETLDRWGVASVEFSPPREASRLRSSPITSTFTSDDLDYNSYVIQYLFRRIETIQPKTWRVRRMERQLTSLKKSLDRVASRHGETIRWNAV